MAELVGLVSSIATLAAAGFHVARKISTVADDLGTAGAQIKGIAVDTKAVAIILRDIEAKLLSGKDSSRSLNGDTREVLAEVVELCRHEIEDLNQNLASLKDDGGRGDTAQLKQKAKWLFDKPKIAAKQASLDSLKLTLGLLLHNVRLFDGDHLQDLSVNHGTPLVSEHRTNTTVVMVHEIDGQEPPPTYRATIEHRDKTRAHGSMIAFEETESEIKIAGLSLSDVDAPRLSDKTSRDMVLAGPPKDLIKVQEKKLGKREKKPSGLLGQLGGRTDVLFALDCDANREYPTTSDR
ncbi:hypothetical protein J7T55_001484 [Diaporthe amygdali]|uniref:uncharacterized protein n=1 Tax=Phomopsis amygdali TaxID=1214568 RepID=UPI0022FF2844|nr:uncharacterized protein J7T55_001484 [Diaporthe amygdali]KAJ0115075.1 hypothetical protein J7T55_001484 [Diaporthe amygdali]